ncbi:MAG TPA: hypothetical protein VEB40_15615 [Flavipsychrobacter sp.]|nr:hypothetical protein [Flavipsychrobacter sp.]
MNFTPFRKYLHKVARFLEKISPMKGELVDIQFIKTEDRVTYTYKKVQKKA